MDLSEILKAEIDRRGLTVTVVAEGADVPFTTVSEFLRGIRDIGTEKASRIAEFLGLELVVSKLRKKDMADYAALLKQLEKSDISTDDDTMEMVRQFAVDIASIEKSYGDEWTVDDAETARQFVADVETLREAGWDDWSEDDAETVARFRQDVYWLSEHGWDDWSEDDVSDVSGLVENLRAIEEMGEEASADRIQEVAEFVENLRAAKRTKRR